MARNTTFKPGNIAILDDSVLEKPETLRKIIGRAGCDISHLKSGVKVTNIVGDDIECQHPTTAKKFTVTARHFVVKNEETVSA